MSWETIIGNILILSNLSFPTNCRNGSCTSMLCSSKCASSSCFSLEFSISFLPNSLSVLTKPKGVSQSSKEMQEPNPEWLKPSIINKSGNFDSATSLYAHAAQGPENT